MVAAAVSSAISNLTEVVLGNAQIQLVLAQFAILLTPIYNAAMGMPRIFTDKSKFPYLEVLLLFDFLKFLFLNYLEIRQLRKDKEKTIPSEVYKYKILKKGDDGEKKFLDGQEYQQDTRKFGIKRSWIMQMWGGGCVWVHPILWYYAGLITNQTSTFMEKQMPPGLLSWGFYQNHLMIPQDSDVQQFLFYFYLTTFLDIPISVMFSLYKDFVIEEKHGFNKKTVGLFVSDLLKGLAIQNIFGQILIPVVQRLQRWGGEQAFLYLTIFLLCFQFFMMWFVPEFIMPLFNKYEDVKDEKLRNRIYQLCKIVEYPLYKLLQVDGSKRSSHSNQYLFGFWRFKRIVLYDTLLHLGFGQILAIVGHELGHWKMSHTIKGMVIGMTVMITNLYVIGLVLFSDISKDIFVSFGYPAGQQKCYILGMMIVGSLLGPIDIILHIFNTQMTRKFEYEQDKYSAVELGYPEEMKAGLKSITTENKGSLNNDWLYSFYHHSHPTLLERLKQVDAEVDKAKKQGKSIPKGVDLADADGIELTQSNGHLKKEQ